MCIFRLMHLFAVKRIVTQTKAKIFGNEPVAVFQNLLANGLWIIIVAAVTFVAAFLKKAW